MAMEGEPYLFPPLPVAVPAAETAPTPDTGKKKDRRGGNRFIPVSSAEGSDTADGLDEDVVAEDATTEEAHDVDLA